MKQLRRLREVTLQKSIKAKQPNGTMLTSYNDIATYKVIEQEITDEVFSSIYRKCGSISTIFTPFHNSPL